MAERSRDGSGVYTAQIEPRPRYPLGRERSCHWIKRPSSKLFAHADEMAWQFSKLGRRKRRCPGFRIAELAIERGQLLAQIDDVQVHVAAGMGAGIVLRCLDQYL